MKDVRINFVKSIIESAENDTQARIVSTYLENQSSSITNVYVNVEDDLNELLCNDEPCEIVRKITMGNFSWGDNFIYISPHGNLNSCDDLEELAPFSDIAEWLVEDADEDVCAIFDYDEIIGFHIVFAEEFSSIFDVEEEELYDWMEEENLNFRKLMQTSWDELYEKYILWRGRM